MEGLSARGMPAVDKRLRRHSTTHVAGPECCWPEKFSTLRFIVDRLCLRILTSSTNPCDRGMKALEWPRGLLRKRNSQDILGETIKARSLIGSATGRYDRPGGGLDISDPKGVGSR